jgi:O-methyltransferase domain/Dimerisation domain
MVPTQDLPPAVAVRRMATAYWVSQALHAAASLGIADRLASGPKNASQLAGETESDPSSLYRLLRALASVGVFEESEDGQFRLTAVGDRLRSDVLGSMLAWVLLLNGPWMRRAWEDLLYSVRTGRPSFDEAHGQPAWDYYEAHPEASELFDRAMTSTAAIKRDAVVAGYGFEGIQVLVDVGGGHGSILAAVLAAHPKMRGVLFDLPRVVRGAGVHFQSVGVVDRWERVAGSFFDSVPVGGDAYLLATVIHDWDDEPATAILKTCHRAMTPGAKLLLLEQVIPPGNEPNPGKFDDLNMLVMHAGRERTASEFRALLESAGFALTRILPTPSQWSVVESVRV